VISFNVLLIIHSVARNHIDSLPPPHPGSRLAGCMHQVSTYQPQNAPNMT